MNSVKSKNLSLKYHQVYKIHVLEKLSLWQTLKSFEPFNVIKSGPLNLIKRDRLTY